MPLKRRFDRFRLGSPITVETDRGLFPVVPSDISASGCFSRSRPPWPTDAEVRKVLIPTAGTTHVDCEAKLFERGTPRPRHQQFAAGFGLEWNLDPHVAKQVDDYLRSVRSGPTSLGKIRYIVTEQKGILSEIAEIERAKFKRTQFTLALIIAYLAYIAAPYSLIESLSIELGAFYAVCGFWISMAILVQADRHLNFLGVVTRQKALLRKAYNANRAYVLGRDPAYYGVTVLPLGLTYDRSKSWTSSSDPRLQSAEDYPGSAQYSSFYPTLYILFLEVMFLLGAVHFLGLLMRTIDGNELNVPQGLTSTSTLDLFDESYFLHALVANVWLLLAWIQFAGNTCMHFHRSVWEGKHIAIHRPNPRATGEAFWLQHGAKGIRKVVLIVLLAYSIICLSGWFPDARANAGVFSHWLARHLLSPWGALGAVAIFFALKVTYVNLSLRCEKDSYWRARSGQ